MKENTVIDSASTHSNEQDDHESRIRNIERRLSLIEKRLERSSEGSVAQTLSKELPPV
jgi:hypothetical protein